MYHVMCEYVCACASTIRNLSFCDTYFATLGLELPQITLLRLLGLRVASFTTFFKCTFTIKLLAKYFHTPASAISISLQ